MASAVPLRVILFHDHRRQIFFLKDSLYFDRPTGDMVHKVQPRRTVMRIKSSKFQVPSHPERIHKVTIFI